MSKNVVAAGFIIYRELQSQIQYLLLQTSYGTHHWTPPKGHVDPGETELEAAYRETHEEAGLSRHQLQVIDGFKKVLEYPVNGKPKTVIYWLARLIDTNSTVVLSSEHQHYEWLGIQDAMKYAGHASQQETLREADAFIQSRATPKSA